MQSLKAQEQAMHSPLGGRGLQKTPSKAPKSGTGCTQRPSSFHPGSL